MAKESSDNKKMPTTIQEVNQKLENYQIQTNTKISTLLISFASFNKDFVDLLQSLKFALSAPPSGTQPAIPAPVLPAGVQHPGGNTDPLPNPALLLGLEQDQPSPATEPSKQDRLLSWATLLAKLAEAGKPASQTESIPGSLGQLTTTLKLLGGLREVFLSEMKTMMSFAKSMAPGLPAELEKQHKLGV